MKKLNTKTSFKSKDKKSSENKSNTKNVALAKTVEVKKAIQKTNENLKEIESELKTKNHSKIKQIQSQKKSNLVVENKIQKPQKDEKNKIGVEKKNRKIKTLKIKNKIKKRIVTLPTRLSSSISKKDQNKQETEPKSLIQTIKKKIQKQMHSQPQPLLKKQKLDEQIKANISSNIFSVINEIKKNLKQQEEKKKSVQKTIICKTPKNSVNLKNKKIKIKKTSVQKIKEVKPLAVSEINKKDAFILHKKTEEAIKVAKNEDRTHKISKNKNFLKNETEKKIKFKILAEKKKIEAKNLLKISNEKKKHDLLLLKEKASKKELLDKMSSLKNDLNSVDKKIEKTNQSLIEIQSNLNQKTQLINTILKQGKEISDKSNEELKKLITIEEKDSKNCNLNQFNEIKTKLLNLENKMKLNDKFFEDLFSKKLALTIRNEFLSANKLSELKKEEQNKKDEKKELIRQTSASKIIKNKRQDRSIEKNINFIIKKTKNQKGNLTVQKQKIYSRNKSPNKKINKQTKVVRKIKKIKPKAIVPAKKEVVYFQKDRKIYNQDPSLLTIPYKKKVITNSNEIISSVMEKNIKSKKNSEKKIQKSEEKREKISEELQFEKNVHVPTSENKNKKEETPSKIKIQEQKIKKNSQPLIDRIEDDIVVNINLNRQPLDSVHKGVILTHRDILHCTDIQNHGQENKIESGSIKKDNNEKGTELEIKELQFEEETKQKLTEEKIKLKETLDEELKTKDMIQPVKVFFDKTDKKYESKQEIGEERTTPVLESSDKKNFFS